MQRNEDLELGELYAAALSDTQARRDETAHEILSYLTIRASAAERIDLVTSGDISLSVMTGQERELLRLWLELYSREPKTRFLDLRSQIKLRGLELDADKLTAGNFTVNTPDECRMALANLGKLNIKLAALDTFENRIGQIAAGKDLTPDVLQELEKAFAQGGREKGGSTHETLTALNAIRHQELNISEFYVKTGFKEFDARFGGLRRGEISVIAARPGEGKTLMAINVMIQAMKADPKLRVLMFSLEMPYADILRRMVVCADNDDGLEQYGAQARTPLTFGDIGSPEPSAAQRYDRAAQKLAALLGDRFRLIDDDPLSIDDLESKLMQACLSFKPDLVAIDYWQLIAGGRGLNLRERLVDISQRKKSMAKKFNFAMLSLAQLRRQQAAGDEIIHPDLSAIAESDQLGRDAALVMCISSQRSVDNFGTQYMFRGLDVVKNRHGRTGLISLILDGEGGRFREKQFEPDGWPEAAKAAKKQQAQQAQPQQPNPWHEVRARPTIQPIAQYGGGHGR